MKPCLLLARLCDLCHYSWKAVRANRFPKILFIKKQTQWLYDKIIIIIKLGYRKILWFVSVSDQVFASAFATDKSQYFA